MFTSEEEVEAGRCDDNFGVRIELGCGKVVDNFFDGLDRPIPKIREFLQRGSGLT